MSIKNQAEMIEKMNTELNSLFSEKIGCAASEAKSSFVASDPRLFDQQAMNKAALGISLNHMLAIPTVDTRNVSTEFIHTGAGEGICVTMQANIPQPFHIVFSRIFKDYKLEGNSFRFSIYDGRDEKAIEEAKEWLNAIDNVLVAMQKRIDVFNHDLVKNIVSEMISREEAKKKKEESESSITELLNKR